MPEANEANINTVTMTDGRVVEFPGTRRMTKSGSINSEGRVEVRLDFINGETRNFLVPDALQARFAQHGAEQKLGDEIAGIKDIDDAVEAVDQLTNRLATGEWTVKRASGAHAGSSVLRRALVEYSGKAPEAIAAFLADKSQAEKMALRSSPGIAEIVQRLEAEKAANSSGTNKIDTEALLGQLEGQA